MSLLMSGALTWVLVRDLELQTAQDQLDRTAQTDAVLVRHLECRFPPAVATNPGLANCELADPIDFTQRLLALASTDRLLLLNRQRMVMFDSGSQDTNGLVIRVAASRRVAGVGEARTSLGGQSFLAAAVAIAPARDPLRASYVLVARPQAAAGASAVSDLAPRLVVAAIAALVAAMLLVLLFSRTLTQPLARLSAAAEDIAAGHYARRVGISGTDEIGMLGTAFDRMAEAVERARKAQRDFLANVSHELKTPLTSLIGFSQALVDGSLKTDVERTRAATVVHEESERVLRMAQELLDLARVEAGSISMHIIAVDLGAQLQQELEVVRPRAVARSLALALDVPADLPPVAADPERLHQVLDNLFDNAVKYAPSGSAVTASARVAGGIVEVVVSNPAGDYRPDPDRMFERFYRANSMNMGGEPPLPGSGEALPPRHPPARSGAVGGVGLGLAISRELTLAMRGRLWADFDGDGRLRVHLSLPVGSSGSGG